MRGSKPGLRWNRRAQGPHAPPAIAGRRIASRHHARWCRLASVNISVQPGFRSPTTVVRWHGKEYARLCAMPIQ